MLKRLLLLSLIFAVSATSISAQTLKGVIKSTEGEAVFGATLFIQSIGLGVVADKDGSFSTNLKPGKYSCEFRCMGYQSVIKEIEIEEEDLFVEIFLSEAAYMISEITVTRGKENPAYAIIRRAIAMAPYYKNYIKQYSYEAHQKGTFRADKIPFVRRSNLNGVNMSELLRKTFIIEAMADVSFEAPNNYTLHVKASNSSIPPELGFDSSNFSISDESIYNDEFQGCVSPIASNALNYYNYFYEEGRQEGDYWVNKIRVEPKKNNPELLGGYIYINEHTWNVVQLDLRQSVLGVSIRYQQYFNRIKPNLFVPTSESAEMTANVLGMFKGEMQYNIARKYENIEIDTSLPVPGMIVLPEREPEVPLVTAQVPQSKNDLKIQELVTKGDLNNREAYKLAQLMQKKAEENSPKKEDKSLEIKRDGDMNITKSVDSLASKRDSLYWIERRILPLTETDKKSYIVGDSLRTELKIDTTSVQNTDEYTISIGGGPIFGTIKLFDTGKWYLGLGGLLSLVREYNFADGVWLGESLTLRGKLSDKTTLSIRPTAYYTTARKEITWETTANLNYSPRGSGRLYFTAGDRAEDFNRASGTLRTENSISSLLSGNPFIHFYRNRYMLIGNSIYIANGLRLSVSADYSKRSAMDYATTYSIFKNNSVRTNIPNSSLYAAIGMQESQSLQSTIEVSYTPKLYYRILSDGRKQYIRSGYPTFGLLYKRGWKTDDLHLNPEFDQLEFRVNQRISLGLFDNIRYSLNIGKFLNKKNLSFADVRHFNTNPLTLSTKSMNGFQLLDNYSYSTDEYWGQMEFDYTSAYLLIKNIRALQAIPFDEALHFRYLYTPDKQHYWEAGYSIGITNVFRVGLFTAWDKFTYRRVGFSANISLFPLR